MQHLQPGLHPLPQSHDNFSSHIRLWASLGCMRLLQWAESAPPTPIAARDMTCRLIPAHYSIQFPSLLAAGHVQRPSTCNSLCELGFRNWPYQWPLAFRSAQKELTPSTWRNAKGLRLNVSSARLLPAQPGARAVIAREQGGDGRRRRLPVRAPVAASCTLEIDTADAHA